MKYAMMSLESHQGVTSSPAPEGPRQTLLGAWPNLEKLQCVNEGPPDCFLIINYSLNLNYALNSWGPIIKAKFKFKCWPQQLSLIPTRVHASKPQCMRCDLVHASRPLRGAVSP